MSLQEREQKDTQLIISKTIYAHTKPDFRKGRDGMLTEQQIQTLKSELLDEKERLEKNIKETDLRGGERDATAELSMYDNHPGDMGTELFEREKDIAIQTHSDSQLDKVEKALQAIENGTYGVCEECKEPISFERLEAVPYTLRCKEHTTERSVPEDRPSEEDVLNPPKANTFSDRRRDGIRDYRDSFQDVAQYGTSETPSDFVGDKDNYGELYDTDLKEGFTEDYESFSSTDITGKHVQVYDTPEKAEVEEDLEDKNIDAPFGDLPYKFSDGYVEENSEDKTK